MKKIKAGVALIAAILSVQYLAPMSSLAAPATVSLPSGMNLGSTSFYDGFGGKPGESAWQVYLGHTDYKGSKDNHGDDIPVFNDPKLKVSVLINQYSHLFDTETKYLGGHPGIDLILPLVHLDADFDSGPPFPALSLDDASGVKFGDPTVSLFLQYDPIMVNGNPVFASRVNAGFTIPTGAYDKHKDINMGNNHWSFSAYWAMTLFLSPKWSISLRPTYYYNFKNTDPASSAPLDTEIQDIQAGQSFSTNYNIAYRVNDVLSIGLNGYYLKQLTDDKVNDSRLKDSREQSFAVGPGAMLDYGNDKFYLTAQRESSVENRFEADSSFTLRWLRIF
ncbi:SphA family protein [Pseudomonas helleri]|uniref:Phenol degradation protein meta n=1 Tax=Pseudomonas helleri TaxID=1608996 RepID=A0A6L5I0G5_9PSED|nr:transporter [Pseudomonas helleri]MQU08151.1 phenol degradation protein meta [Pseudomonas helleri]